MNIARSTLIYDGECDFCVCSVGWLKRIIKDQVECLPFQSSLKRFPQIIVENCERSIHWIDVDGNIFEGAEAIFRTLACVPGKTWPLWLYKNIPGFSLVTECVYKVISKNRKFLGFIY